jgi:hypothetical protein
MSEEIENEAEGVLPEAPAEEIVKEEEKINEPGEAGE